MCSDYQYVLANYLPDKIMFMFIFIFGKKKHTIKPFDLSTIVLHTDHSWYTCYV